MPALPKVENDAIRAAIERWEGNVTGCAAELGLHPKNLRERIDRLGIDLAEIRARNAAKRTGTVPHVPFRTGTLGTDRHVSNVPGAPVRNGRPKGTGPKTPSDTWSENGRTPRLTGVQAVLKADEEIPIRKAAKRRPPTRLQPPQLDALADAVFVLQERYRVPTDENVILQQFFDEAFAGWLASKLKGAAPEKPKKAQE
jgi:hypothetical protein